MQAEKNKEIWSLVIEKIQKILDFNEFSINLWFAETALHTLTETKAYISVSVTHKKNIIEEKYKNAVAQALHAVLEKNVEPIFISTEEKSFEEQFSELVENQAEKNVRDDDDPHNKPNMFFEGTSFKEYSFDNFVVGSTNKFAYATCRAMASDQNCVYNPLFIYGPPGLGKTHLLYATIREISLLRPDAKILFVKCEDFTNELIAAIEHNKTQAFRDKYRTVDLLLVDDIQFISGKRAVQEEYFHTFNTLFEAGKQIIMTSDRPPKAIADLDSRLRSRFEMRVMADIQPPDLELRIAIIKRKSDILKIEIPNDVLLFLGEEITENIRQIEGVIMKLKVLSFLRGKDIDIDIAKSIVYEITNSYGKPKITYNDIITKVADAYDLTPDDLLGKKQSQNIALPRHVAIYLIRTMLALSLNDIGRIFGRNHTTIMSSENKVNALLKESPDFSDKIEQLKNDIKAK